jgi:hypothetical protein
MARPGTDAVCPRSFFYGVLVFPFIWELTKQMTYNGYLVSRFIRLVIAARFHAVDLCLRT